jgi:hypothetical protein
MRFNNGNFEVVQNNGRNLITKGTYTSNGGNVSLRITDMWGPALGSGFEQKWYSRSELIAASMPDSYFLMSGTYTACGGGGGGGIISAGLPAPTGLTATAVFSSAISL